MNDTTGITNTHIHERALKTDDPIQYDYVTGAHIPTNADHPKTDPGLDAPVLQGRAGPNDDSSIVHTVSTSPHHDDDDEARGIQDHITNTQPPQPVTQEYNRQVAHHKSHDILSIGPSKSNEQRFFDEVKNICENHDEQYVAGPDPHTLAQHRTKNWPRPNGLPTNLAAIYDRVRQSGLPNVLGIRETLPTKLNLGEWRAHLADYPEYAELLDFVEFGFPLGYLGPESNYDIKYNHSSANDFSSDINKFLEKEISLGGIIGPFSDKPFTPWLHAAPFMSRPKRDSIDRRIIADLSFPQELSINAFILKNAIWGQARNHSLPTVSEFVEKVKEMGPGSYMSTVDISRAYKNFKSDPLDWPLLCAHWDDKYYCDITLPFGARASSLHMQTVANAIVRILNERGVFARVYLDDIITLSQDKDSAMKHHDQVIQVLSSLGLPIAHEKTQPPARTVQWLGICINTEDMTISIPHDKVQDTLTIVKKFHKRRSMTKRDLQSVLGRLIHVAKCVPPARLFVSRLLDALREARRKYIKISPEMRADFAWFISFCKGWNGVSLIPEPAPNKTITLDASLTGIGATDGYRAYGSQVGEDHQLARNISEIEAVNVAVALHTFIDKSYIGAHVRVNCDNMASVQLLKTGKGRNKVMLEVARSIWMLQAEFGFHISYEHIRGRDNKLADALSRAHVAPVMARYAQEQLNSLNITRVNPCMYIFSIIDENLFL